MQRLSQVLCAMLCGIAILLSQSHGARAQGVFTVTIVPEGNQPRWVREAWVGLTLPFALRLTCDLTQLGDESARPGYVVYQSLAIKALEKKSPKAADWLRKNGYPNKIEFFCFVHDSSQHTLLPVRKDRLFLFPWLTFHAPHFPRPIFLCTLFVRIGE